ncbi:ATP-binding cassette domain-containing protein, partial [Spirochaetota bacterium]
MKVFNVKSIYAGYGGLPVIRGMSLDVTKGDFIGIIGPNGSGKSTLIRVLSGIIKPDSGLISFLGKS